MYDEKGIMLSDNISGINRVAELFVTYDSIAVEVKSVITS